MRKVDLKLQFFLVAMYNARGALRERRQLERANGVLCAGKYDGFATPPSSISTCEAAGGSTPHLGLSVDNVKPTGGWYI